MNTILLDQVHGAASLAGMDPAAAVLTVESVLHAFPVVGRRRSNRRRMIAAGMDANAVPAWVRVAWSVSKWFVPLQWRLVIDTVIWAVDFFLLPT